MITAMMVIHEFAPGQTSVDFKAAPAPATAREIELANKIRDAIGSVMVNEGKAGASVSGIQRDNPRN